MSEISTAGTFADSWARTVSEHGARTFLLFEEPSGATATWTYAEFDRILEGVADRLSACGVKAGSAVHLALANSPAFVAVWLAANRMGAWIVPSDPMARRPELADHLERTRPSVGLCAVNRADVYRSALVDAGVSAEVIEVDEADASSLPSSGASYTDWVTPALSDRAAVMFTSGTTGRPKGVEITQANYAFAGKVMAEASELTVEDRQIVVLPLFHANAQYYSFAPAIWSGASVALMHTFSASNFLPQCARHSATAASLFAAPIRMILARGEEVDGVRLRHCWYAQNVTGEQYEQLSRWLGCRARQLYGMTETIPAVLTEAVDKPRHDSMGSVTEGCELQLQDAEGRPVGVGEIGEIAVRGVPGETIFGGYLDDPVATTASFRNGWFLSGDRARRDEDGRHYFDGRHSEVLKVAGENVSTVEVEGVLSTHPDVHEAAVLGSPDLIRDEVPVAFVVPVDTERAPSEEELREWCEERLAKAKVPRSFTFLEELPRTSVGKVRKFVLKESA